MQCSSNTSTPYCQFHSIKLKSRVEFSWNKATLSSIIPSSYMDQFFYFESKHFATFFLHLEMESFCFQLTTRGNKLISWFRDFKWFQVISSDFKWFQVISSDFRWFQVISDDFRWFQMISGDFRWFQMISGDFRWFQVISSDFRWFQVISNDFH
jgi:hypothetical protein